MQFEIIKELKQNFPNVIIPTFSDSYANDNLKDGDEYWACAYDTNSTEKGMGYIQKPIFGIIKKEGRLFVFYPYNKKGLISKSKKVNVSSRIFSNNEKESKEIYNFLVDKQIELLETLLNKTKNDKI